MASQNKQENQKVNAGKLTFQAVFWAKQEGQRFQIIISALSCT